MNFWMFVCGPSKIAIHGQTFSVYDLVLSLVAVALVCLFLVSMSGAARRLRREDCPGVVIYPQYETQYELSRLQEKLQVSP
jgi:hypothetical protein